MKPLDSGAASTPGAVGRAQLGLRMWTTTGRPVGGRVGSKSVEKSYADTYGGERPVAAAHRTAGHALRPSRNETPTGCTATVAFSGSTTKS